MGPPWPVASVALAPVAVGSVAWSTGGTPRLTVIVGATFGFVHGGPARLLPPRALGPDDDAPLLPNAGVTLTGHAWAPGGRPAPRSVVRLALVRDRAILDKTVHVLGDRGAEDAAPAPFVAIPLAWERAYGGPGHEENPAGRRVPNLVDPVDPKRPAGFGAIPRSSAPWRRSPPGVPGTRAVDVPEGMDMRRLHAAPPDQQLDAIQGDEWIVLDGMHPSVARLATRLAGARAVARAWPLRGDPIPVELVADTLAIDADQRTFTLVWRGSLAPADRLASMRVEGGLLLPGEPPPWPAAPPRRAVRTLVDVDPRAVVPGDVLPFRAVRTGEAPKAPPPAGPMGEAPKPPPPAARPPGDDDEMTGTVDLGRLMARPLAPFALAEPSAHGPDAAPIPGAPWSDDAAAPAPRPRQGEVETLVVLGGKEVDLAASVGAGARPLGHATAPEPRRIPETAPPPPEPPRIVQAVLPPEPALFPAADIVTVPEPVRVPPPAPVPEAARVPIAAPVVDPVRVVAPVAPPPVPPTEPARAEAPAPRAPDAKPSQPEPASPSGGANPLREKVLAALAARQPLRGLDLRNADLRGIDFTRASLHGCQLAGADLAGCTLREARLADADLTGTSLVGAVLADADLTRADLSRARAEKADFTGCTATRARFAGGTWDAAVFARVDAAGADFTDASLANARFDGAAMPDVCLDGVRGEGASFREARMPRLRAEAASFARATFEACEAPSATWERATLDEATFAGANLAGSSFERASFPRATFATARLDEANLGRANGEEANLADATLEGVDLRFSRFAGASFEGADLRSALGSKADLSRARLARANLGAANLRSSKLAGASLANATLDAADLRDADLERADLQGASRKGAKLQGANLKDALGVEGG